ncbi:MAG: alanine dehydrogenase [Gammaproteobacteria bacterium]|nr:MAG: alanine dehydrogenase [Gammaproteobacteria bacterium]
MRIGIPREVKNHEHRVALRPVDAGRLVAAGHRVFLETRAGEGAGFSDFEYQQQGVQIVGRASEAWDVDLVVKVKEPQVSEYPFLRKDLVLFTYLHLAADLTLAEALLETGTCAIGYETVQTEDGMLPLLMPMSRIAGRLAAQIGARYLQTENGTSVRGKGILPGGMMNAPPARVLILGGGQVGSQAAEVALGLGASVCVMDVQANRLEWLENHFHDYSRRFTARRMSSQGLEELIRKTDLLIGAALVTGARAPHLLTIDHLKNMPADGVLIDVAIDQGGVAESSRPTTYDDPVYRVEKIIHCCLPNLPSCVARTATLALAEAVCPYVQLLAEKGVDQAIKVNSALARGINIRSGVAVHPAIKAVLESH